MTALKGKKGHRLKIELEAALLRGAIAHGQASLKQCTSDAIDKVSTPAPNNTPNGGLNPHQDSKTQHHFRFATFPA